MQKRLFTIGIQITLSVKKHQNKIKISKIVFLGIINNVCFYDFYNDALSLRTRLTLQPLAWIMRGEIRITFPVL